MEIMEVVVFICQTEKSQGIVTAQIEQETMRVTSPDFLRPAFIIESNYIEAVKNLVSLESESF